jgi:hypothetical protein
MRVPGVVVLGRLAGELLGGCRLGAGVEVLDLGLAEDAVQQGVSSESRSHQPLLLTAKTHM